MSVQKTAMLHFGRSGSTVLAKMLESHPAIAWHHEYFTLLEQRDPNAAVMSPDKMLSRIDTLVAGANSARRLVGYEIKLINFLHNPACTAQQFAQALAAQDNPAHIVVLRRRNVLKRILSSFRAMKTGVYHIKSDQGLSQTRYTVPLQALGDPDTGIKATGIVDLLDKVIAREDATIRNVRNTGLDVHTLTYEDDIENDPIQGYRKMLGFFDLPPQDVQPSLKKTGTALQDEIANYDDLKVALQNTPYAWML